MNNEGYVKEMSETGYGPDAIDAFHRICLPYLGNTYFPDKSIPVLDLGIGSGHCALSLFDAGWKKMYGFDIDNFHQKYFEEHGVHFASGDITTGKLPYADNFFSAVVSFHVIEHISGSENYLREIKRVFIPGGVAFLVTPDWRKQYKTFWRDHTHVHPFDKESIARLTRANGLIPEVKSFGVLRGVGRTGIWKKFPNLMFTGIDMICIAKKPLAE
jgi:SAM-dependent methyltransferase